MTGARAVEVVSPGALLLVEDAGRPGFAAMGVTGSGFADPASAALANRLVGNAPGEAVLECLLGGAALRAVGPVPVTLAVTGAEAALRVTAADGGSRTAAGNAPLWLAPGETLHLGPTVRGVRLYVALRGGLDVPAVLGSRSRDILAGLGPAPLRAGQRLPLAGREGPWPGVDAAPVPRPPAAGDVVELPLCPGPRRDWFTPGALALLVRQPWTVTQRSNRVGMRLQGARALSRRVAGELPSEGLVPGALQVPADGQPVLFLADHPVTGGYPVVGVVPSGALSVAAQCPPGARIRFRP